jgi:hypothetical protein
MRPQDDQGARGKGLTLLIYLDLSDAIATKDRGKSFGQSKQASDSRHTKYHRNNT